MLRSENNNNAAIKHTPLPDRGVVGRRARYDEVESLEIALVKLPITVYRQLYNPDSEDISITHLPYFLTCCFVLVCVWGKKNWDCMLVSPRKSDDVVVEKELGIAKGGVCRN